MDAPEVLAVTAVGDLAPDVAAPTFLLTTAPAEDGQEPNLTCTECGTGFFHQGRGRKPSKCPDCRGKRTATVSGTGSRRKPTASAAAAADVLCQLNSGIALALGVTGMVATAGEIHAREDAFRAQVLIGLEADPKLCASICRAGSTGGKAALLLGYMALASAVVPTAVKEVKGKSAANESFGLLDYFRKTQDE